LVLKYFGSPQNLRFIDIIKFIISDLIKSWALKHFYLMFLGEFEPQNFEALCCGQLAQRDSWPGIY